MAAGILTPRRIYYKANICVLCGFAFVQSEITSTGETIERNLFNKKLKLTDDKVKSIQHVLSEFQHDSVSSSNGVCKNCYRTVERIIKIEKEVEQLQIEISRSRSSVRTKYQLATPSPTKSKIEKRLRISPEKTVKRPFPSSFKKVTVVNIPPIPTILPKTEKNEPVCKPLSVRRSLPFSTVENVQDKTDSSLEGEVEVSLNFEKYSFKFMFDL